MAKVAIIRRNGIGDLLCSFPLILYFRKYFPSAHLTLFASARNAPLLPFLPPLDEVIIFPPTGNKYFQIMKTALRYRKNHYDVAISAKTSPMKLVNLFLFALGAKERIAYVEKNWHAHLINRPILFNEKEAKLKHQALKSLHTIEPSYKEVPEEFYPKLYPNNLNRSVRITGPILLLSATTTRPTSRFDPFRYAEVVNHIYSEVPPFHVLLIGEKKDAPRALAIQEALKVPHTLYFPRNFEEFMVLLNRSDYYFVGDGGIAHLGAALDKSQVVLFGETNPSEWAPLSRKARMHYDPLHVNRLSDEHLQNSLMEMMRG